MSRTPYDANRADFSRRCHTFARTAVYPRLFGMEAADLRFEDKEGSDEDLRLGIDRIVHVSYSGGFIPNTVQERFRQASYARYRDLTITERNGYSGEDSEMFKCYAQWFVYGYFSNTIDSIIELVACPTPSLMSAIVRGTVPSRRERDNGKGQSFVYVSFDELRKRRLVSLHIRDNEVVFDALDNGLDEDEKDDIHILPDGRALFKHGPCEWRYFPKEKVA